MADSLIKNITVNDDEAGLRLDVLLSERFNEVSRTHLKKLIRDGDVQIKGDVTRQADQRVQVGQIINVRFAAKPVFEIRPEPMELDIVYEDDHLLVLNKAAGIIVHPTDTQLSGTLVNGLLHYCDSLAPAGGAIRPGVVHRIDRGTTGLLVFAKTDDAFHGLKEQFKVHSIRRIYNAVAIGNFTEDEGTIDAPLSRRYGGNRTMRVGGRGRQRESVTHFQVLERFGDFTFLSVQLETGRTHQIRVHMEYIHHALAADHQYGPGKPDKKLSPEVLDALKRLDRPALHARVLGFMHPANGKYLEFETDLPEDMRKLVAVLRAERQKRD